jgi:hypothetical protein
MLPDALRGFQMLLEVSQRVSDARRCSQRFKMLSEALRASYAQGLYHSKICFSELHRACDTATFAFPKCAGHIPQQDLLFRNAQSLRHSNRGSQTLSDALRGSQKLSEALRVSQMLSDALRSSQRFPDAPGGSQRISEALRSSQSLRGS